MSSLPDPITVFPAAEQPRVREASLRYALLMEVPEVMHDLVERWIFSKVGDRSDDWGPPSTSANAVASICRAMSTPGHYGRTPGLSGRDAEAAKKLMGHAWPKKQHVQYLAYGMGCCALGVDVSRDLGRLVFDIVPSHEWWVTPHPEDPLEAVAWYHLRVRTVIVDGKPTQVYAWDTWDISNPDEPVFKICRAQQNGVLGEDITLAVTGQPALEGDQYPARFDGGRPFVPYSVHRARDTDEFYNWYLGKGAFEGALDDLLIGAYCLKAAADATGKSHIITNIKVPGAKSTTLSDGSVVQGFRLSPGEVVIGEHDPTRQPFAFSFGSGEMLKELAEFRSFHRNSLAVDMGVTPSDAARVGANPMSGEAIRLTNETKRMEQHRLEPLCRASDLDLIRKSFAVAHAERMTTIAEPEVSITYHEIRRSPAEERQHLEALQWDLEHGVMSPVDIYIARHPGTSRDQALQELARIEQDRAAIKAGAQTTPNTPVGGAMPTPLVEDPEEPTHA